MKSKKVFCYFHSDDLDGWSSSAVVLKKYPESTFCGYNYEPKLPILAKGFDIVFMVDCSCSVEEMKYLMDNNKKFVWIDHHAKKIWDTLKVMNPDGLRDTDNNNSACVLTWKYLFPKKKPSDVLLYIEDQDIWKFTLPNSREINMALNIDCKDNRMYLERLLNDEIFEINLLKLIEHGTLYLKMENNQIDFLLKTVRVLDFHGYKTGVVNSPIHTSFIGSRLLAENQDIQVALIWYCFGDAVYCSLRSRGDVDVAVLASKYGGGGHKPASGFRIKKDVIEDILEMK
jgi:oligoribonuclease NrnB/cAMP/cGMP phosphodiesterase (DHH superfamily)